MSFPIIGEKIIVVHISVEARLDQYPRAAPWGAVDAPGERGG